MEHAPPGITNYLGRRVLMVAFGVVLVTGAAWLLQIYFGHKTLIDHIREDAISRSCLQLENQVDQALVFARTQQTLVEKQVREVIRQRVETACESVTSYVSQNRGQVPEERLTDQVRELLRAMSLQHDNNYIFAVSQEGVVELQPTQRWLEGASTVNLDSLNTAVIHDLIRLTRDGSATYHEYSWYRPGADDAAHVKLSYIKVCPAIGWVIGCGEYLEDMKAEVQERTLDWMESTRFGGQGYLFAGDWNGVSLLGPAKGQNIMHIRDLFGRPVVEELIQRSMGDGDTMIYILPPMNGLRPALNLTYVKGLKEWSWYIGAATHLHEINSLVAKEQEMRRRSMMDALLVILATLIITGSLAGVVVRRFGARIASDIAVFNRFFRQATEHSAPIRTQDLRLQDLRDTAELANASIRQRHEAEQALRNSEEYTRLLIENAPDAFFALDKSGCFVEVNEQFCRSLGYTRDELLGLHARDVEVQYPIRDEMASFFAELLELGRLTELGRHRRKDGSTFPVETSLAPFEMGDTRLIYGFARDITERSESEQNLRRSEERFRSVIQSVPMGVHLFCLAEDRTLVFEGANPATDRILGIHHDELVGKTAEEAFPALTGSTTLEECARIAREGGTYCDENILYEDDRSISSVYEITAFQTQPNHVAVFFLDVTERRRQEDEIRLSEQRLRAMLDTIGAGVYTVDPNTRTVTYINPAASQLLGLKREEIVGKSCRGFLCDSGVQDCGLTNPQLIGRSLERELVRPDGTRVSVMKSISRAFVGGREVLLESFIDLSSLRNAEAEKARLEEQLRQAQKMEAIGQLAGGVAHDFNNLLQVINGYTALALEDLSDEHDAAESLHEVTRAGERAARLVEQLLAFSRRQIMQPVSLDMNSVVEDLFSMLRRLIGEHIQLIFQQGNDLSKVLADRGMVEQVLMNLVLNARDAMPEGGDLVIQTADRHLDDEFCQAHGLGQAGDYVQLSVRDTGEGMPEEVLSHIFEPFFTTKETGRGTGLGLATVYGIVSQHKGLVLVSSEEGKGSTFDVYLPVVVAGVTSADSGIDTEAPGGHETILLAEDDDLVRSLAEQILLRSGYTVLSARDGKEAVELFESESRHIDMLLLDVVMPHLSGQEVMERARAMRADLPVLFASGYSDSAIHTNFILHEGVRLVQKPYHHKELLRAVRDTLDKT